MSYTTYALNANNDIYLDAQGNIATVQDDQAILQTVKTEVGLWIGEYIYNTSIGVQYNLILGKTLNEALLYAELRIAAMRVTGVLGIANITYIWNGTTRQLMVNMVVQLQSGNQTVQIEGISE